ncbi:RE1-silencing transcription factor-like 8 [Homarus americanus]|uniref:RE1-silencing transcription factor-like 8 n=1 Tax=Homarus americanus TaxID=6706 RepID=A0A8J5JUU2_HOMAM|nr:RE1-silencing transcription factor-like 8 [Homarus americanus]
MKVVGSHFPSASYGIIEEPQIYTHQRNYLQNRRTSRCNVLSTQEFGKNKLTNARDKPHKCQLCPYAASTAYNLKTHMSTHTGEKPFACMHCSYRTAHSSDLNVHMRASKMKLIVGISLQALNVEKPFACPICPYSTVFIVDE